MTDRAPIVLEFQHKALYAIGSAILAPAAVLFLLGLNGMLVAGDVIDANTSNLLVLSSAVVGALMLLLAVIHTIRLFPKDRDVAVDPAKRRFPYSMPIFVITGIANLGMGLANDRVWSIEIGLAGLALGIGLFLQSRYGVAEPVETQVPTDPLPKPSADATYE